MIFTVNKKNDKVIGATLVYDNGDIERIVVNDDGTESKSFEKHQEKDS